MTQQSVEAPGIVSIDDHVLETPDIWQDRLPSRYRDTGPRLVRERGMFRFTSTPTGAVKTYTPSTDGRWTDVWHYDDLAIPLVRGTAFAGNETLDDGQDAITFDEVRPGCYDMKARLADMDLNGVDASLNFPNEFVRFAGQRFLSAKDKDLALLCVRAYNDWMLDGWCAPSGGRLIPMCIVPLWDAALAAEEVRRTAALGSRSVTFTELPAYLGLPSIHSGAWDPLLEACNDTDTVMSMHIGSGSQMPITSADVCHAVFGSLVHINSMMSISDWLLSGVLIRYPRLRILFAESQIGWVPYQLQRMDYVWENYGGWAWGEHHGRDVLSEPPSAYFRERVLCSFFDDDHGVKSIELAGMIDNVALEVDYPHGDSTWPHSGKIVASIMETLPAPDAYKVIRGNAERFLRL